MVEASHHEAGAAGSGGAARTPTYGVDFDDRRYTPMPFSFAWSRRGLWIAAFALGSAMATAGLFHRSTSKVPRGPRALAAASAAAAAVPGGCDLLSTSDAEATLGLHARRNMHSDICELRRASATGVHEDLPVIGIRLYRTISRPAFESEAASLASLAGKVLQPVGGLGEEALGGGGLLFVYANGAAFSISRGDPSISDDALMQLARGALTRLPRVSAPAR